MNRISMNRISRRMMLLAMASAPCLPARDRDFWNRKDRSKWSEREIDRLLTNSPWAKEVSAAVAPNRFDVPPSSFQGSGIPGIGGIQLPGAGIPGLGGGRGRTSAGRADLKITCIVRWDSAAPIIAATENLLPRAFTGHYAISVSGLPLQAADRAAAADDSALDALLARVKGTTSLRAARRGRVHPQLAQFIPGVTTKGFLFGFAREDFLLGVEDGSVTFDTNIEGVRLNAVYDLREMIYRGEIAL
jgi:hypothetical protein